MKALLSSTLRACIDPGAGFGMGDEAGRMLLHQAVQHGLLGLVALAVERWAWAGR
jgi:hypothetical protein